MFVKDLRLIMLFDFYGELLSEKQKIMFDYYYNDDLSLSEIGEFEGITRQGVRDCIVKSEVLLKGYEEALGLHSKILSFRADVDALSEEAVKAGADAEIVRKISALKDRTY